ncbi:hypothetical protein V6N13_043238 [Hibiscus sabdariffa]
MKDKEAQKVSTISKLNPQSKGTESTDGLYGPWMFVDNRRRRSTNTMRGNHGKQLSSAGASGSWFSVLNSDDMEYVHAESNEGAKKGSDFVMKIVHPNTVASSTDPVISQGDLATDPMVIKGDSNEPMAQ